MKVYVKAVSFLLTLLLAMACQKEKETPSSISAPPPAVVVNTGPDEQTTAMDIFRARQFSDNRYGQKIILTSKRLTAEAISKGIVVQVSPNWDDYVMLPATVQYIDISYVAYSGYIEIWTKRKEKVPFVLTVAVEYR